MERHREKAEFELHHRELLSGILAANIANFAGKVLKEGVHLVPADFMPSKAATREQDKLAEQRRLVAANLRDWARAHNTRIAAEEEAAKKKTQPS